ncbi:exo-alpha-sialidase [Flagellimonas sp. S3867]|uniref:sialidase family protein n=1 Tax=Flagellimonas sp. S3867 TaxID=2768063 RepID=UPI001684F32F|nr:sialidase family protein [Flagellimonas sp. S3867]
MNQLHFKYPSIFIIACFGLLSSCKHDKKTISKEKIQSITLFDSKIDQNVACYRIPSIITTLNGTLIAAIDERVESCNDLRDNKDINIVIRKSEDNGVTWSAIASLVDYPFGESASDPSMILDEDTGEIFLFYNYMNLETHPDQYLFKVIKSKDHGESWSRPIDITNQIAPENSTTDFQFITSGKGIQTSSGKLLHTLVNLEKGIFVFGSGDHGENWYLINTPITPGDESKIVELSDGSWMVNSRVNKSGLRYVHKSSNNGQSWEAHADSTLIDPSCNASIIRYSLAKNEGINRLLFSNPSSSSDRKNLTVKVSYDEGESWKHAKSIASEMAAYSSLCILKDGKIGLFYETDNYQRNVFTSFTLDWITDGGDVTP